MCDMCFMLPRLLCPTCPAEAKSPFLTTWGPLSLNVLLIVVGYQFTGPSLNPFISFGWYVFYKQGSAAEHLLVFWAAPFGGALLAGLMVRVLEARKKARRSRKSPAGIIAAAAKKNK